jgi:hypothetical protein
VHGFGHVRVADGSMLGWEITSTGAFVATAGFVVEAGRAVEGKVGIELKLDQLMLTGS